MSELKKKKSNPKMSAAKMIEALRERGYLVYEPDEFEMAIDYYRDEGREELRGKLNEAVQCALSLAKAYKALREQCAR